MAMKFLLTALAVTLCSLLAEACDVLRQPQRPRSGLEIKNTRFWTNVSPKMMYLGSADEKAFYAVNLPMDREAAADYCQSSNMELASSTLTEDQKELLGSAVNEVAYTFGIDIEKLPISYWTSSYPTEVYDEAMIALDSDKCETTSFSDYKMTTGTTKCTDALEITICEADD